MSVEVFEREVEGITVLDLLGRLTVEAGAEELREHISNLVAQGKKQIILNLKEVPYIDSTGLGALVVSHSALQKSGGALKLLNVSKRHVELLVLTKLTTIFEMYDNEEAAVNSFFPEREVRRFDILEFVRSQREEREAGAESPLLAHSEADEKITGNSK